jgi:hypothetical protein
VLLLLPVWLMGVAAYRLAPGVRAPGVRGEGRHAAAGLAVFAATAVLALAWIQLDLSVRLRTLMYAHWPELTFALHASNQVAGDTVLGVIVSLHFAAVPSLGRFARPLLRLARPIRAAASYTLSAYLYHMPLLVLLWSGIGLRSRAVYPLLALAIIALGRLSEHRLGAAQALLRRGLARLPGAARWPA